MKSGCLWITVIPDNQVPVAPAQVVQEVIFHQLQQAVR